MVATHPQKRTRQSAMKDRLIQKLFITIVPVIPFFGLGQKKHSCSILIGGSTLKDGKQTMKQTSASYACFNSKQTAQSGRALTTFGTYRSKGFLRHQRWSDHSATKRVPISGVCCMKFSFADASQRVWSNNRPST